MGRINVPGCSWLFTSTGVAANVLQYQTAQLVHLSMDYVYSPIRSYLTSSILIHLYMKMIITYVC